MNIEFDQEPGDKSSKGGGSNSRLLLLVLLLLVAVFGYLFYFTDLIKPRQEAQAPAPVQPSQVKQPIPPRPGGQPPVGASAESSQPGAVTPATTAQSEPPKVGQEQKAPEKAKTEPPKPEAAKAAKPEVPAAKKEQPKAAEPAKAQVDAKQKAAQTQADDKQKAAPPQTTTKEVKKPVSTPEKPKTARGEEGKKAAAKKEATGVAVAKTRITAKASAAPKPAAAKRAGEYTLRIGEYVVPTAMEKDKVKVREAGLTPVVKQGVRKKEPMIRLFFGEYADQETARKELQRLQDATVEGFVLKEGGAYQVYAGSYFAQERATKEQERLAGLGYRLTLRKVNVAVPTVLLTAGKYGSRDEALKDAARLKKKGLAPSVIPNDK
ncbi:hypothetical protein GEOBC_00750 [Geobacteraceae bacterium]|nr:hypothetical protein GEOBC_00750 [Geobacteraceae bacterium]